jgi:hypothetical protein
MLHVAQGEIITTRGKVTAGLGGAASQRLSQTTTKQVRGRSQNYRLCLRNSFIRPGNHQGEGSNRCVDASPGRSWPPRRQASRYAQLAGVNQGDGVKLQHLLRRAGQRAALRDHPAVDVRDAAVLQDPGLRPIYDHAAALDDFTDSTGTPIALPPFIHSFRINQFLQGALTTYSGAKGSFTGPWTTSKVVGHQQRPAASVRDDPGLAVRAVDGRPAGQRGGPRERRLRRLGAVVPAPSGLGPHLVPASPARAAVCPG